MPASASRSSKAVPRDADRERFEAAWDGFAAALRRRRSRVADRPDAKLTPAQYHLLSALEGGRALAVGELARAAGVSSPTATRMLDGLERDGLVTRQPAVEDRRRISVTTTGAGASALAETRARIDGIRERLFAELTPEERAQAEALLPRLAEALEQL
ncbi:MAG: MarR family transcriptional regulator [Thermoleophilaceae bacterium]